MPGGSGPFVGGDHYARDQKLRVEIRHPRKTTPLLPFPERAGAGGDGEGGGDAGRGGEGVIVSGTCQD